MIPWALVFAADMAGEWVADERKKRERNAMVGNLCFFSWFVGAGLNRMEVLGMCCIFVGGDVVVETAALLLRMRMGLMGGGMMSLGGMS